MNRVRYRIWSNIE